MIHLHVHSRGSMLSGTTSVEHLVARAKELGQKALALTDHHGLYTAIPFYQACREAGIQPILGVDLWTGEGRTVLLARGEPGYRALCRLITAFHEDASFALADRLPECAEHLFALIPDAILLRKLAHLNRDCADRLPPVWALVERFDSPAARSREWALLAEAKQSGIPLVAGNDVHFLSPEHYKYHVMLRAIDENKTIDPTCWENALEVGRVGLPRLAEPQAWFKSPAEMQEMFSDMPQALDNTERIAEACELTLPLGQLEFPEFPLPDDETPYSWLWKLCFDGARKRYQPLNPRVVDRLKYELGVIHEMHLAAYFLIVWDIVRFCQEQQIPCVGRGSAADSLVSYLLGITHGCPIEYDLYFERFLNPERKGAPDIDLDLCWRRRDEVLEYVYTKYGQDRVAMISIHATFCARSALRETAKVFGLPEQEINALTRAVPHYGNVRDLEKQRFRLPETRHLKFDEALYAQLWDVARFIDGFPRHIGTHACGIVVSAHPLADRAPLQIAPKGLQVTQYEMHAVEAMGLLKIDLLGMRSLSVIADVTRAVAEREGKRLQLSGLLPHDEATYQMINSGQTLGCFQLESPGMRQLLTKLNVDNLNTIIDSISVIRPGPNDAGMMRRYVARHNGQEQPVYLDPRLEPILKDTYGILLYQEDVLKVAGTIAGMSLGEADVFRRAMTKLRTPDNMASNRKMFLDGALQRGLKREVADELWRQVSGFAGYAFCKAHSVSYGILAYQSAWLKRHYPAFFMESVINNGGGFYSTAIYVEEARRLGLRILPPDINESEEGFTSGEDWLRAGLFWVKHLSHRSLQAILETRSQRPFCSLTDLHQRVRLTRPELESLIRCGALDRFGKDRRELLWRLDLLSQKKGPRPKTPESLFATVDVPTTERSLSASLPQLKPLSLGKRLYWEGEILGFSVTMHPVEYIRSKMKNAGWVKITELAAYSGQRVRVAGMVRTTKRTKTKQGQFMKFVTIEDETGLVDAVLFPDQYQRWGRVVTGTRFLVVQGRVMNDCGSITIEAERVERMRRNESGVSVTQKQSR